MAGRRKVTTKTIKIPYPAWYSGNLFFLVFFLIIWLPVGILLLVKNGSIARGKSRVYLSYRGKWGWLFFWGVLFFPISVLLLLIKGVDVIEEETLVEEQIVIERF